MTDVVSIFTGKQMKLDAIERIPDEINNPWFKRAHVGKFLGIISIKD